MINLNKDMPFIKRKLKPFNIAIILYTVLVSVIVIYFSIVDNSQYIKTDNQHITAIADAVYRGIRDIDIVCADGNKRILVHHIKSDIDDTWDSDWYIEDVDNFDIIKLTNNTYVLTDTNKLFNTRVSEPDTFNLLCRMRVKSNE
jgi:hypothetical protein